MAESYTGDEGDDALDAGYDVMDGTEDRRDGWRAINKTRDYVAAVKNLFSTANWPWARISGKPTTYPPSSHTHSSLSLGAALFRYKTDTLEWIHHQNQYIGGYLNLQGAFYNPSTRRIKKDITPAPAVGGLFPALVEYTRIGGDGTRELGYLAEDLAGTDAERFVKFDQDGQPEAVAYVALLVAQVAQLHARVAELEARE